MGRVAAELKGGLEQVGEFAGWLFFFQQADDATDFRVIFLFECCQALVVEGPAGSWWLRGAQNEREERDGHEASSQQNGDKEAALAGQPSD